MSDIKENSLTLWLFTFGLCFATFHILPAFLNYEIKHRFMASEIVDLLTPFVIILILYKIYKIQIAESQNIKFWVKILFIVGAITFVEGHGIHLAANAIHRHLQADNSSLYTLIYFFDETLGHILWDGGTIILVGGLVLVSLHKKEMTRRKNHILIIIGAIFFGFTYFVNAVEGQTVWFTFPYAIFLVITISYIPNKYKTAINQNCVLAFFFFGYIIASGFFLFWLVWQRGFPQFSELGWI